MNHNTKNTNKKKTKNSKRKGVFLQCSEMKRPPAGTLMGKQVDSNSSCYDLKIPDCAASTGLKLVCKLQSAGHQPSKDTKKPVRDLFGL